MSMIRIVTAAAAVWVATAACGCEIPSVVMIPADHRDIQRHEQRIRDDTTAYLDGMQAYADCLRAELDAAGGDAAPSMVKALLVQRNNQAAAESEAVLNWFKQALGITSNPNVGAPAGGGAAPETSDERGHDKEN